MKENHKGSILKDWILPLAAAVVIAIVVNKTLFFMVEVPTTSMYPTIQQGDRLLVTKIYDMGSLKRGDIIVFNSKELNMVLVKRLIGLPGDKVEIKQDGSLYINGAKYDEPYVKQPYIKQLGDITIRTNFQVPENCFLFMGDNRRDSLDARYWKNPYIPKEEIQGKAQIMLYPFDRIKILS